MQAGLSWFINRPYKWALELSTRWRYASVAVAVMVLLVTGGWVAGGLLPWRFFPSVDADFISASIEMPPGTPAPLTEDVVERVRLATLDLEEQVGWEGEAPLIRFTQATVGGRPFFGARNQRDAAAGLGDPRLGEVVIQLIDPSERDIRTGTIRALWRDNVGSLPGVRSLKFNDSLISAGDPISIRLVARRRLRPPAVGRGRAQAGGCARSPASARSPTASSRASRSSRSPA